MLDIAADLIWPNDHDAIELPVLGRCTVIAVKRCDALPPCCLRNATFRAITASISKRPNSDLPKSMEF